MNIKSKYLLVLTCCITFLSLFTGTAKSSTLYSVNDIYDGDTITLDNGAKIRLLQIDAPELSPSECYGQEARQALIQLIGKSKVTLQSDGISDDKDRYGRFLRYIFIGKKNINLELVRTGAAAPYFYQGERGRYSKQLLKAAEVAKTNKVGLWKSCPGTKLQPNSAITTSARVVTRSKSPNNSTGDNCDPNYLGCIPTSPPDLDCPDIKRLGLAPVQVIGVDTHRLDGDGDGVGCDR
jgi:micrococcal nuclease